MPYFMTKLAALSRLLLHATDFSQRGEGLSITALNALLQHFAAYCSVLQSIQWCQARCCNQLQADPSKFGLSNTKNEVFLIWMTIAKVAKSYQEFIMHK